MNNQWQKYVDAAKQQQPLLTQSDVEQLLQNPKVKVVVKKQWLNFKLLFIMSMLTTLFVGLMWIQQPTKKTTTSTPIKQQPKSITELSIQKTETTEKRKEQPLVEKPKTTYELPSRKPRAKADFDFLNSNFTPPILFNEAPQEQINDEPERTYFNEKGELILTYDELAKLGIVTDGSVLRYNVTTDTLRPFWDEGKKVIKQPVYKFKSESGGRRSTQGLSDTVGDSYFNKFFAIVLEETSTSNEKVEESYLATEIIPSKGYEKDYFNELKPQLIPVLVEVQHNNKNKQITFWFKNEPDFINALPIECAAAVKQKYGPTMPANYFKSVREKYSKPLSYTKGFDSLTIVSLQQRIINLSDEALKSLQIKRKSDKIQLIFWEKQIKNKKVHIYKSSYKSKRQYSISTHAAWRPFSGLKNESKVNNSPIAITNYGISQFNFLRNMDDSIGPFMDNPSYTYFAQIAPKLHPIMVDSDHVIWFPNTYLTYKTIQESANQKAGLNPYKMNKLVLTPEQLAKLKITYQADGIKIPSFDNGVQSIYSIYDNNGSTSQLSGFKFKPIDADSAQNFEIDTINKPVNIKITNWKSIAVPILVTDLKGIGWYQSELETDKFITKEEIDYMVKNNLSPLTYLPYINAQIKAKELLTKQLTTFVPIVLKHPTIKNTGVIAWYKPDSAFLSLLPVELSSAIKQELTAISTNNKGASCTYFEACKELGMDWEINAFPNPTENELNLTIESANEGRYRVEITDIEGKTIKELSKDVKLLSGKHQLNFNISNLAKGMYLLQVINDKREILVKRIVKL